MELEVYRCKECRHVLFTEKHIEDHIKATHSFKGEEKGKSIQCNSHFLSTEVPWLDSYKITTSAEKGKIYCPFCKCKIGNFCWHGSRCSCGSYVAPAFQIQKSKVDSQIVIVTPKE
ncbi:hypothetical protein ADUPG1_006568 [Aduncisulcus paluster]|uniref:C2H2-type domain-containing protein n=1 Tax=Aduncisulcus paluster TaxID=2918883 RepID=A0ABQ5KM60_9EUKA|nr:hypothetical protein ADUPG1_006568 [Aduncisulcus paluster]|eukprot:gnl/Carplike_NY0171/6643_a9120_176.p1 GENE.gnl/Carplike_NY0171/6643_a9120_176~~gnl/Carplike_NY0171/6643_a9120_176.p1  ORF type:complete len:116 (+),score=6.78 gnl/Carplike_NY0171/6643_a9120_176:158-505(+)